MNVMSQIQASSMLIMVMRLGWRIAYMVMTVSTSMVMSRWTSIRASPLRRSFPMLDLRYACTRFKPLKARSAVQLVTGRDKQAQQRSDVWVAIDIHPHVYA